SKALGASPPETVAALASDVLERLANQIDVARRRQAEVMAESVRVAVEGVPLPVRGIVRKALLG
ncbi:MAG: hypothetical protein ABR571_16815, partial [Jatrophihabitans sp.]|uniref:hypothetical protein n=1 Tax=Jatrophihabitans sp. TaxID=1932789 RepID=UPI003912F6CC